MKEGLKRDLAAFLQVTGSPYQAVYRHKYSVQQWGSRMSWPQLVWYVCSV